MVSLRAVLCAHISRIRAYSLHHYSCIVVAIGISERSTLCCKMQLIMDRWCVAKSGMVTTVICLLGSHHHCLSRQGQLIYPIIKVRGYLTIDGTLTCLVRCNHCSCAAVACRWCVLLLFARYHECLACALRDLRVTTRLVNCLITLLVSYLVTQVLIVVKLILIVA